MSIDIEIQNELIKKNNEVKKAHEWDINRRVDFEYLMELNNINQQTQKGNKLKTMFNARGRRII